MSSSESGLTELELKLSAFAVLYYAVLWLEDTLLSDVRTCTAPLVLVVIVLDQPDLCWEVVWVLL